MCTWGFEFLTLCRTLCKLYGIDIYANHFNFLQGFASGSLDEDAESVRLFTACGMELLVAQSYSKNLGLYAERIGAINII